jgi:hypothetical protein
VKLVKFHITSGVVSYTSGLIYKILRGMNTSFIWCICISSWWSGWSVLDCWGLLLYIFYSLFFVHNIRFAVSHWFCYCSPWVAVVQVMFLAFILFCDPLLSWCFPCVDPICSFAVSTKPNFIFNPLEPSGYYMYHQP